MLGCVSYDVLRPIPFASFLLTKLCLLVIQICDNLKCIEIVGSDRIINLLFLKMKKLVKDWVDGLVAHPACSTCLK